MNAFDLPFEMLGLFGHGTVLFDYAWVAKYRNSVSRRNACGPAGCAPRLVPTQGHAALIP